jgi:hypothetical protein
VVNESGSDFSGDRIRRDSVMWSLAISHRPAANVRRTWHIRLADPVRQTYTRHAGECSIAASEAH